MEFQNFLAENCTGIFVVGAIVVLLYALYKAYSHAWKDIPAFISFSVSKPLKIDYLEYSMLKGGFYVRNSVHPSFWIKESKDIYEEPINTEKEYYLYTCPSNNRYNFISTVKITNERYNTISKVHFKRIFKQYLVLYVFLGTCAITLGIVFLLACLEK